jgi:hypothetical protein
MSAPTLLTRIQDDIEDRVENAVDAVPAPVKTRLADFSDQVQVIVSDGLDRLGDILPAERLGGFDLKDIDVPSPAELVDGGFGIAHSVLDAQHRFANSLLGTAPDVSEPAKAVKATTTKAKASTKKASTKAKASTKKATTKAKASTKKTTTAAKKATKKS